MSWPFTSLVLTEEILIVISCEVSFSTGLAAQGFAGTNELQIVQTAGDALVAVLAIWLCISAVILISSIQSFLYDRKREKREREQAARDAEYHENRMKLLEK